MCSRGLQVEDLIEQQRSRTTGIENVGKEEERECSRDIAFEILQQQGKVNILGKVLIEQVK